MLYQFTDEMITLPKSLKLPQLITDRKQGGNDACGHDFPCLAILMGVAEVWAGMKDQAFKALFKFIFQPAEEREFMDGTMAGPELMVKEGVMKDSMRFLIAYWAQVERGK